jgi:hypothetical protein
MNNRFFIHCSYFFRIGFSHAREKNLRLLKKDLLENKAVFPGIIR